MAHMPRPLVNGVQVNFQAWFVPKSAHPQFTGLDEFLMSYQEEPITALGQPDRDPPSFFNNLSVTQQLRDSDLYKGLGLHLRDTYDVNSDLIDAYNLVHNFRLAAHSNKLTRRPYATEDLLSATAYARAFWPTNRFSAVVPDYERALVVGALDLDVTAGMIPIHGIGRFGGDQATEPANIEGRSEDIYVAGAAGAGVLFQIATDGTSSIEGNMAGQTVTTTLNDIDMARRSKAFAEWRSSYAGADATGFENENALIAEMMQGFTVPESAQHRPWLLDQTRVPVGFVERHATDGASLEQSTSQGRTQASLNLMVPQQNEGGMIICLVEVLPERMYERQEDLFQRIINPRSLPDAVRDVQRTEPVDMVENARLDVLHTVPDGLYGYEPMNDHWNRSYTRFGGAYYQADPSNPWVEQRSAIWQANIIDPTFTDDHFLAPPNFPHDVFSDPTAPAFEMTVRHSVAISGLTQIGDVLVENNDDYEEVTNPS